MNISKINSTAFKGYLTIVNNDNRYRYNTDNIDYVINNYKKKAVTIYGCSTDSYNGKKQKQNISIPYKSITPNNVMAAYSAACSSEKADIILISNETSKIEKIK